MFRLPGVPNKMENNDLSLQERLKLSFTMVFNKENISFIRNSQSNAKSLHNLNLILSKIFKLFDFCVNNLPIDSLPKQNSYTEVIKFLSKLNEFSKNRDFWSAAAINEFLELSLYLKNLKSKNRLNLHALS